MKDISIKIITEGPASLCTQPLCSRVTGFTTHSFCFWVCCSRSIFSMHCTSFAVCPSLIIRNAVEAGWCCCRFLLALWAVLSSILGLGLCSIFLIGIVCFFVFLFIAAFLVPGLIAVILRFRFIIDFRPVVLHFALYFLHLFPIIVLLCASCLCWLLFLPDSNTSPKSWKWAHSLPSNNPFPDEISPPSAKSPLPALSTQIPSPVYFVPLPFHFPTLWIGSGYTDWIYFRCIIFFCFRVSLLRVISPRGRSRRRTAVEILGNLVGFILNKRLFFQWIRSLLLMCTCSLIVFKATIFQQIFNLLYKLFIYWWDPTFSSFRLCNQLAISAFRGWFHSKPLLVQFPPVVLRHFHSLRFLSHLCTFSVFLWLPHCLCYLLAIASTCPICALLAVLYFVVLV